MSSNSSATARQILPETDLQTDVVVEGGERKKRVRMNKSMRRQAIVDQAVDFFYVRGLNAQLKDFAASIGVSEGLIFHYFGTRQQLMENVYQATYQKLWPDEEMAALKDRTIPIAKRLETFYVAFLGSQDRLEWITGVVAASLQDPGHRLRFDTEISNFLSLLHEEIYAAYGREPRKMSPLDRELMWHLHATMAAYLYRKHIWRETVSTDHRALVRRVLKNFLCEFEYEAKAGQAESAGDVA